MLTTMTLTIKEAAIIKMWRLFVKANLSDTDALAIITDILTDTNPEFKHPDLKQ